MSESVLAQLAALKSAPVADLKRKWRDLFEREPPPYNRRFLESRLAYRIQELAYGGLSEAALERLDAIADELEGKTTKRRRDAAVGRPIAGTRPRITPLVYPTLNAEDVRTVPRKRRTNCVVKGQPWPAPGRGPRSGPEGLRGRH